jgi:hypothetical protein
MRKVFLTLGIIVAVVASGALLGWLAGRRPGIANPNLPETPPTVRSPGDGHPAPILANPSGVKPGSGTNSSRGQLAVVSPTAGGNAGSETNWEDKLEEILNNADTDDTNKVKQLLAMFPRLPEDGQTEVAQHLSNLVENDDYAPLGQLLKNARLPEPVLDVLMGDLLNRPNALKLPMFLDLARTPDHPEASEAKDLLELYLDEDYGSDWPKWEQKMKEWLKENPD